MNKLIKLTLLIILMPTAICADKTKIEFVRKQLIQTPIEQASSKKYIAIKLLSSLSLSLFFDWGIREIIKQIPIFFIDLEFKRGVTPEESSDLVKKKLKLLEKKTTPQLMTSGLLALLIYYISHKIILRASVKSNFVKFINEFESNKEFIPKNLYLILSELHSSYNKTGKLDLKKVSLLKAQLKKLVESK